MRKNVTQKDVWLPNANYKLEKMPQDQSKVLDWNDLNGKPSVRIWTCKECLQLLLTGVKP